MPITKNIIIKSCPFCGKYPILKTKKGLFYLECCFIRSFGYKKTADDLIKIWNTRNIIF